MEKEQCQKWHEHLIVRGEPMSEQDYCWREQKNTTQTYCERIVSEVRRI